FVFCLMLDQQVTHPEMYNKSALADLPDAPAEARAELARATAADVGRFKYGLGPLAGASEYGALLAQLPVGTQGTTANRDCLEWLLETFREFPVAVELRHR